MLDLGCFSSSRLLVDEDEFDVEVKREAEKYSAKRRNESERETIKLENKKRRKEGLDVLKLPKLPSKARSESPSSDESGVLASTSYLLGNGNDSGSWIARSGKRSTKRRRRVDNDNLRYEGQVILEYNPLYRLAGLPDPNQDSKHTANMSPLPPKPLSNDEVPIPKRPASIASDEREGASEEAYEYDDEVIVPGPSLPKDAGFGEARETIEGGYSEDELFNGKKSPKLQSTQSHNNVKDNQLRSSFNRPDFPSSSSNIAMVSLSLDPQIPYIAIPASINRYLKDYQRDGVRFLYGKYAQGRGGVLGDDMGLGKTVQIIAFLAAIMRKTGTSEDLERRKSFIRSIGEDISPKHWPSALIICPKFLIRNWERELETWGFFEHRAWHSDTSAIVRSQFLKGYLDIVLISYETARNYIEELKDLPFSVVIADEAHRLKEPRAAITLALKKIQCLSCFALTGTILQNSVTELWSILDFVDRGYAGTLTQWREFAVNPIKKGHRHEGTAKDVVLGIMRLGVMYQKVLPHFYLRRDKRLIAHELPEKRDLVVYCPLAERQVKAYQALIDSDDVKFILRRKEKCDCGSDQPRSKCCHTFNEHGESVTEVVLKNINALSKVANHFGLLYHAKDDTAATREVNRRIFQVCTGEDYDGKQHNVVEAALDPANCGKWQLLSDLLTNWRQDPNKNKVLIFSNSVRLLKMIAEFIATTFSGFSFDMITGEVGTDERMDMVDRFQDPSGDQYILLISTLAGGVGLNLTAANKVVIFDPAWNPANDLQAMDRAFRIGQQRPVDVYRLIGQGTLEELMYERQIHKQQKARQLNQGTFESRIHQGYEGATNAEDQGELFGTQNIFKFDPKGFVPGRLERVRLAEDRFMQDLIDAEFNDAESLEADSDDETGRDMRQERKLRAEKKAEENAHRRRNDDAVIKTVLGEQRGVRREDEIMKSFGISTHVHDAAFRDSPEEASMFQIGLSLLRSNPEIAAKIKANDLGKLGRTTATKGKAKVTLGPRKETDPNEEPWKERVAKGRTASGAKMALAELSD